MGLRCTHLVSTKKPDTRAFFGLQPLKAEDETSHNSSKRKAEEISSEIAGQEDDGTPGPEVRGGDDEYPVLLDSPQVEGTNDRIPDTANHVEVAEQWWDCPICARPQPADERRFNDHLDSCLSRQTIRDAVQRDTTEAPPLLPEPPIVKRIKSSGEKKRGRLAGPDDPKQKKLSFS